MGMVKAWSQDNRDCMDSIRKSPRPYEHVGADLRACPMGEHTGSPLQFLFRNYIYMHCIIFKEKSL